MTVQQVEPDDLVSDGGHGHQVDEKGRRVWTDQEMRAANAADYAWRTGRGPALTADQSDQLRAYRRTRKHDLRNLRGPQHLHNRPKALGITLENAVDLDSKGVGLAEAAQQIGIKRSSLVRALDRNGLDDVLARMTSRDRRDH